MKLYKVEHDEKGIWYFTTLAKAARYIGTSQTYIIQCFKRACRCKGWSIEDVSNSIDTVITRYVDPER